MKEDETEDDMSHFSGGDEEFLCAESNDESRSLWFDASEGAHLLRREEVIASDEHEVWMPHEDLVRLEASSSPFSWWRKAGCRVTTLQKESAEVWDFGRVTLDVSYGETGAAP